MNSNERRKDIMKMLLNLREPVKGSNLAKKYNVTRQIIVKDIALLRARGENIIATPDGYMVGGDKVNKITVIVAVNHKEDDLEHELGAIVKYGGVVEDVIVEHPLYGEIKGMLMIKNLNDLESFIKKYNNSSAKMLSMLTNGIHLHTISADTQDNINLILDELNKKQGRTIVMVIHELNNAARFADHMIGIKKGKIVCEGDAYDVMTKDNLKELFNIDAEIATDPRTNKPICITYDMV